MIAFDERDAAIVAARERAFNLVSGPRVGDWIEFADGVVRRVSHHWGDSVQSSDGGSFYFGKGYVSFSGALFPSVPIESLSLTEETRRGEVWFFHHDFWGAGRGVHTTIGFRVFKCSEVAP